MKKNQKKLLGALLAVAATSATAAFSIVPGKAQAEGGSDSSVFEGGIFTVLRHEESAPGHKGARIIVLSTKEDKSAHALAFYQTAGGYEGTGMVCEVETPGDRSLSCVSNDGREILTVGDLDSNFCTALRETLGKKYSGEQNPIMRPIDCEENYPKEKYPNAACVCYQIEHPKAANVLAGDAATTLNPPGRGSGSGGHD